MKEGELVKGMCIRMTGEFYDKHVLNGDSRLQYPEKYKLAYYGIVGGPLGGIMANTGTRHYVKFYDWDKNFIEEMGIWGGWLEEIIGPPTYNIDSIISNLTELENKFKNK